MQYLGLGVGKRTLRERQQPVSGSRTGPPHRARESEGRSGCHTRVQELQRDGQSAIGAIPWLNPGSMALPATSQQAIRFRSSFHLHRTVAALKIAEVQSEKSGRSGQRQLWKLHLCNRGKPSYVNRRHVTRMPTARNTNSATAAKLRVRAVRLVLRCAARSSS